MGKFRIGQTILLTGIILSSESIGENRAGNHSTPSPRTSASSPTYTIKLPTYDSERVQKVTQELLENFREKRPENWEALERAAGYVPWNQVPSRSLPAFDADKVSGAVEKLANEISQERPGSWDDLKGILKNYTGTIPPAVMENIIAYRILQRKASDANSDGLENIMRTPKPAAESNNVGAPTPKAAMDSVASNKIGLFSQFFPSGSSAPAVGAGVTAANPASKGSTSASFPFFDAKPNSPAALNRDAPPSAKALASNSSPPSVEKNAVTPAVLPGPAAKTVEAPPNPTSPSAATVKPAALAKAEPPAPPTTASVLPNIFTGDLLKGTSPATANSPATPVNYSLAEPSPEAEENEDAAGLPDPGSDSSVVASAPSNSAIEEEPENDTGWENFLAFLQRWVLMAVDAEPIAKPSPAHAPERGLASLANIGGDPRAFAEFNRWDMAARHQAIVEWGESIGLEARQALRIYHCALGTAWLATLLFALWAGRRLWVWHHLNLENRSSDEQSSGPNTSSPL